MRILLLSTLVVLSACNVPVPHAPPVSTDPLRASNRELEPPNSLPPGFTTNHPLAPDTGVIGTTSLGY